MTPYQYKPDLSVRYSPRVPRQLRALVNKICVKADMPESDVLRYSFEAAVLTAPKRLKRMSHMSMEELDAMITVRTSKRIGQKVEALWRSNSNAMHADVLRALLESVLPLAHKLGMAHVMKMREEGIGTGARTLR